MLTVFLERAYIDISAAATLLNVDETYFLCSRNAAVNLPFQIDDEAVVWFDFEAVKAIIPLVEEWEKMPAMFKAMTEGYEETSANRKHL